MATTVLQIWTNKKHMNRCYCKNGNFCCCFGLRKSSDKMISPHKFIKVQSSEKKSSKSSRVGSSSTSFSTAPTLLTSVSTLSMLPSTASSSDHRLTEQRELYERSKEHLSQTLDVRFYGISQPTLKNRETEWFYDDNQIAKLQQFRLRNADECLSTCSRYSMDVVNRSRDSAEVAEVVTEKYRLNERGLLQSCDVRTKETKVPIVVNSKSAVRDILRQKLNASKDQERFVQKALCLPEKSLALRYQKTQ